MNKSIEILCAVICTYEKKKLAIICPIGKMISSLETFNPEYLVKRFSGDINKAYSIDTLFEVEQMIAPIVNRFGKIPDRSHATIAGIRNAETGEDIPDIKKEIDELYSIEKDLESSGYNTYSVFYVEHNIEDFTDEDDIPFSEDRTLMKINIDDYNLEGLINEIRNSNIDLSTNIPTLFNECFIDKNYYNIIGYDKYLGIDDIKQFFNSIEEGSLYIPFAKIDKYGKLNLANGENLELNLINTGEMEFKEDNECGISIDLIDNKYIFNPVEYVSNENCSISILEDVGYLTNKILDIIEKFNKIC